MRENKNIERIYQEKFKDFEVSPPELAWQTIREKLDSKKKKRRVVPFWLKASGIAASLIVVFSVLFHQVDNNFKKNNPVVNSETKKSNSNKTNKISTPKTNKSNQFNTNSLVLEKEINSNSVVINPDLNLNSKINNKNTNNKNLNYSTSSTSEIVLNRNNKNKIQTKTSDNLTSINKKSNSEFLNKTSSKNNTIKSDLKDINTFTNNTSNSGLSDINLNKIPKNKTEIIVEKNTENSNQITSEIILAESIKLDTTVLATNTTKENALEKLLREKETKKVATTKENWSKWAISSNVSPIFFNSFTNGSPLSNEFATNKKTFNNSTSFGVGLAYNVSKRVTIKTGVNNLNLDFDTENIAFYTSFDDQSKIANTNIERNANGKYLVLKNKTDVSRNENPIDLVAENLGNLNQKLQYLEVPVEISYAIINKKLGVAIKGGMSTLFLTENQITVKSDDGNMQIGKASNVNNLHFSSNLGLGLYYNFNKKIQLNADPTLKYFINTLNKNTENFKPYIIGIITGISYKF